RRARALQEPPPLLPHGRRRPRRPRRRDHRGGRRAPSPRAAEERPGEDRRMRALVVSDLHSNIEALRAVMNRVRRKKYEQVLCHGSPNDEDEYVFNESHARVVFEMTTAPIILYGHTHLPVIFAMDRHGRLRGASVRGETTVRLDREHRYLINPGSVGQPRDRNPQSSFAMFDARKMTVQFFRVTYDIAKTQIAILKAGLPPILAHRLAHGT